MWMAYAAVRLGLSPRVRGEPCLIGRLPWRRTVYPRVCGGAP